MLFRAPQCDEISFTAGLATSPLASLLGRAGLCWLISEPMDAPWTHIGVSECLVMTLPGGISSVKMGT